MEGERFWLLNIRRRRRIGMETQFRRPYLFEGSERLPHNNSLRSLGPERTKAESRNRSQCKNWTRRGERAAVSWWPPPLKNWGGATLSLYRGPGSLGHGVLRRSWGEEQKLPATFYRDDRSSKMNVWSLCRCLKYYWPQTPPTAPCSKTCL